MSIQLLYTQLSIVLYTQLTLPRNKKQKQYKNIQLNEGFNNIISRIAVAGLARPGIYLYSDHHWSSAYPRQCAGAWLEG